MNKLIKGGIIFTVVLLAIVFISISDKMGEGDMVNILSALAAVTILVVAIGVSLKYVRQMQTDTATGEDSGHAWDDIREFKNKLPTGWAIMFIVLMVWAVYYFFIGYPLNEYSQIGEYNEEVAKHKAKFESQWSDLSEEKLYEMGESVYLVSCSPCHGVIGDGLSGKAADLTKWGTAQTVKEILKWGSSIPSNGMVMPSRNELFDANGNTMTDAQVDVISNWLATGQSKSDQEAIGVYMNFCVSCHAEDGSGYEGTVAADIRSLETFFPFIIKHGKKGKLGTMPAFKSLLTETQIKAVSVYIIEEYKTTRK